MPRNAIHNNEAAKRFEMKTDGQPAILTYRLSRDRITFLHMEVPPEWEGQGLGGELAEAGLEYARKARLKVLPLCPFVAHYVDRHPEYQDLLVPGSGERAGGS